MGSVDQTPEFYVTVGDPVDSSAVHPARVKLVHLSLQKIKNKNVNIFMEIFLKLNYPECDKIWEIVK